MRVYPGGFSYPVLGRRDSFDAPRAVDVVTAAAAESGLSVQEYALRQAEVARQDAEGRTAVSVGVAGTAAATELAADVAALRPAYMEGALLDSVIPHAYNPGR